jgi:AraC-like DNA-binding protein
MLAYLMGQAEQRSTPKTEAVPRDPDLAPLRRLIDEHPERPWPLRRLAQVAGYSPFHLLRAFQRLFHETPHRYIVRRRIDRARQLLADTDWSVTRIGLAVGFESPGAFSTKFREQVGWPPSAYRGRVLDQRARPLVYIPGCHVETYRLKQQFSRSAPVPPLVSSI